MYRRRRRGGNKGEERGWKTQSTDIPLPSTLQCVPWNASRQLHMPIFSHHSRAARPQPYAKLSSFHAVHTSQERFAIQLSCLSFHLLSCMKSNLYRKKDTSLFYIPHANALVYNILYLWIRGASALLMSPKVSLIQSLTVAILQRINDTESHSYLTKASCIIILHLQKSGTMYIKAKEVDPFRKYAQQTMHGADHTPFAIGSLSVENGWVRLQIKPQPFSCYWPLL